ncbi:MAG: alpha/beta fold hydrolase [Balneolaceae bacterium]
MTRKIHDLFLILIITGWLTPALFAQSGSLLEYRAPDGTTATVTNMAEWEEKRWQILANVQKVMGELPDRSRLDSPEVFVRDTLSTDRYERYLIYYTAREGELIPAYLYIPHRKGTDGTLPAMIALHETGPPGKDIADGARPNLGYGKELAERGYVVLAPDFPGFGELEAYDFENDGYLSGSMAGIFNHMRGVDLLQDRDDVDGDRIGTIGHSLGGYNSMFLAAFDPRIKVVVSSAGWNQFDYYRTDTTGLENWASRYHMPLIQERFDLDLEQMPFNFHDIIGAIVPRPFFSNSPVGDDIFDFAGVPPGIELVREAYRFLEVEENLQLRTPNVAHSFPTEIRREAYRFIDHHLNHVPGRHEIE